MHGGACIFHCGANQNSNSLLQILYHMHECILTVNNHRDNEEQPMQNGREYVAVMEMGEEAEEPEVEQMFVD